MSISLSINKKTKDPVVKFSPELDMQTATKHMQVFLDTFPQMLVDLVSNLYPMLRPVTEEERNAHVYVFLDGEQGEQENQIYRAKKHCYDILTQLFSSTLTALFPDVEYIIQCANYQQDFVFTHTDEEYEEYKKEVDAVTNYVRENISTIVSKMLDEMLEGDPDGDTRMAKESV